MSIETYQFNLPITPGAIPPVLHLSQYASGRTFTAILRDDANVPFELDSGATAVIKGRNAAGIAWQQNCSVSGANVTFTPSGAATDQFGVMPVTIEITESEEVISPLCVIFNIQKAGYTNEEAVLSPDFETAIQAAVAQAIAEGGLGFSDEFKEALLACFNGVAWATAGGQALVDDLEAALYPDVHLVSIAAAYDQDRPIYDSDSAADNYAKVELDLIVTALYSDGTSEAVTDYTLSGTFTAGTSTITVSYGGKTADISVSVLQNLDSIAYGDLTYRDIFETNNLVPLGDFEEDLALTTSWKNYNGDSTKQYKINAGSPSQSSEACVSPTKSLKCFGSSSAQIQYVDYARTSGTYLACLSVNVSRYSAGKAGINVYFTQGVVAIDLSKNVVTDGWEQLVGTGSVSGASPTLSVYIGSMSSANLDAYIDDVVITPLPGGLTTDAAMVLYKKYLELRGATV